MNKQELKQQIRQLSSEGQYVSAIPLMEKYCKLIGEEHGLNSDRYVTVINDLGGMYRNVGDFSNAESTFNKALELIERKKGKQSVQYATTTVNLACMYRFQNEFDKAEKLFLSAIDIYDNDEEMKILKVPNNCGLTPENMQIKLDYEKNNVDKRNLYANACNNIGVLYQDMKEFEKAISYHYKSLDYLKGTENHEYLAITLNNFVNPYLQEKRYDDAIAVAKESLAILEKYCTKRHPFYSTSLNNLGSIYYHLKRYDEALECFEDVEKELKYTFGENSPQFKSCKKNIEVVKNLMVNNNG